MTVADPINPVTGDWCLTWSHDCAKGPLEASAALAGAVRRGMARSKATQSTPPGNMGG